MREVVDDFLNTDDFLTIKNACLNDPDFLWQFNPVVTGGFDSLNHDESQPFQFVHGLYRNFFPTSNYFKIVNPIIKKLPIKNLLRVKVNLTTRTETIIQSHFHIDTQQNHKVSIFYVNTNNGYTLFEDGTKVESIENRILTFNGSEKHCGTNCTDKQCRIVINLNWQ